ncbi:glutathione peroxidase [Kangiella spongicola]|uniref:Glutathione peroxidase n=1 Tax=Kangiella spongicola TaxID=796379 RepID=A0A318D1W3_9GAMM|nr:glutathione peroxidase [Kangiella spongicola]MBV34363.1 glutathione peroxidase [Rickettsiales bacterium]PXF63232.1 glutathione peroxidase [Kangiella spongicola]
MPTIYDYSAVLNNGQEVSLKEYQGKVLLIVNTASACGFTPQYEGLEKLYQEFSGQGLEVLAFPCNQFGKQESGSDDEIKNFCDLNFNISFPLFQKVDVNGDNAHPLYQHLKKEATGLLGSQKIKWNFTKFLVDKDGKVIERYGSITKPENIKDDIRKLL